MKCLKKLTGRLLFQERIRIISFLIDQKKRTRYDENAGFHPLFLNYSRQGDTSMNRPLMDSSFSTAVAAGSELAQAVGTNQKAAVAGDPAMAGFGAGVHQYLNMLLTQIYAKTTTLLAANMVLISLLLSTRASTLLGLAPFYVGAVFFFALSAITSTIVLFPRLHRHDANGLLFWRAILMRNTPEEYYASIQALDKVMVEEEYAKDNYHISKTIRYKDTMLRAAITVFIIGMMCAVVGVVIPIVFFSHH